MEYAYFFPKLELSKIRTLLVSLAVLFEFSSGALFLKCPIFLCSIILFLCFDSFKFRYIFTWSCFSIYDATKRVIFEVFVYSNHIFYRLLDDFNSESKRSLRLYSPHESWVMMKTRKSLRIEFQRIIFLNSPDSFQNSLSWFRTTEWSILLCQLIYFLKIHMKNSIWKESFWKRDLQTSLLSCKIAYISFNFANTSFIFFWFIFLIPFHSNIWNISASICAWSDCWTICRFI